MKTWLKLGLPLVVCGAVVEIGLTQQDSPAVKAESTPKRQNTVRPRIRKLHVPVRIDNGPAVAQEVEVAEGETDSADAVHHEDAEREPSALPESRAALVVAYRDDVCACASLECVRRLNGRYLNQLGDAPSDGTPPETTEHAINQTRDCIKRLDRQAAAAHP